MHYRSSRLDVLCKKCVIRNFAKFTGKHLCHSLPFNTVAGRPPTLLKKDSDAGVFLWILQNFLEHLFLQNISGGWFWHYITKPTILPSWNYQCITVTWQWQLKTWKTYSLKKSIKFPIIQAKKHCWHCVSFPTFSMKIKKWTQLH